MGKVTVSTIKQAAEVQPLVLLLWSIADSNRLPQHCQCCALPDELMPRIADAKVIPFLKLTKFLAIFFEIVQKKGFLDKSHSLRGKDDKLLIFIDLTSFHLSEKPGFS